MFLKANLGWLRGYPDAITDGRLDWITVTEPGVDTIGLVSLDRDKLRDGVTTWDTLVRRFPRALPRVVSMRRWSQEVPRTLQLVREALDQQERPPASLLSDTSLYPAALQARRDRLPQELAALVDALSWVLRFTPDALPRALDWIEARQAQLTAIVAHSDVRTGIQLWLLTDTDKAHRTDDIVAWMGDPLHWTTPTQDDGVISALTDPMLRGEEGRPDPPSPRIGDDLQRLFDWLYLQPRPIRRRTLTLVSLLYMPGWTQQWAGWWEALEQTLVQPGSMDEIRAALDALSQRQPPVLRPEETFPLIRDYCAPDMARSFKPMCAVLRAIPQVWRGMPLRMALLWHWEYFRSEPAFAAMLSTLRPVVASEKTLLAIWKHLPEPWRDEERPHWGMDVDLFCHSWPGADPALPLERLPIALRAASRVKRSETFDADEDNYLDRNILTLSHTFDDPDELVRVLQVIRDAVGDKEIPYAAARTAAAMAKLGYAQETLLPFLTTNSDAPLQALELCQRADREDIFRLLVDSGQRKRIASLWSMASAVQQNGTCLPPSRQPAQDTGWIQQYPPPLRPALALLAANVPRPEARAEALLHRDVPSQARLDREIQALEARAAAGPAHLKKRLEALIQRRDAPRPLSPERARYLVQKIEATITTDALERWEADLKSRFRELIGADLSLEDHPHLTAIVSGLLALPDFEKALGFSILKRRAAPGPWWPWEDDRNTAYLERLRQKGIDPTPWMQPRHRRMVGDNDQVVWLSFSEDPLETFRMGAHFNTCLRPQGINFFSTVANIVDANKRVIYARAEDGTVAGRCLTVIARSGGLLAFEFYAHDPGLNFERLAKAWLVDLAAEMNTLCVDSGPVESIVARRWYDDGAEDHAKQFPGLEDGSPLREALKSMPLDALIGALEEAFAPLQLSPMTLPMVLSLPELAERPELVVPLLGLLRKMPDLAPPARMKGATLALAAGRPQAAASLVQDQIKAALRSAYVVRYEHEPILSLLSTLSPHAVLQYCRSHRQEIDEWASWVVPYQATALEKMHRPVQAARLRKKHGLG